MTWLETWKAEEETRLAQQYREARARMQDFDIPMCQCCDFGNYTEECDCDDSVKQERCGNTTQHLAPRHRLQHLEYLEEVLSVMDLDHADTYDGLFWRRDNGDPDGRMWLYVTCSDLFYWAHADAEKVEYDDVGILWACYHDLEAISDLETIYVTELFAARKRQMRPMRRWLDREIAGHRLAQAVKDLFLAAGPERDLESEG